MNYDHADLKYVITSLDDAAGLSPDGPRQNDVTNAKSWWPCFSTMHTWKLRTARASSAANATAESKTVTRNPSFTRSLAKLARHRLDSLAKYFGGNWKRGENKIDATRADCHRGTIEHQTSFT